MALDAGYLSLLVAEIGREAAGARIEKIAQPEKEALIFTLRAKDGAKRLLINAGSQNPRIGFTALQADNPPVPPAFCLLLRKHLSGARFLSIKQSGFERVATLSFECRNELGDLVERRLVAEMMGKYSNLIFTDSEGKILGVLRPVDFSTSTKRQLLVGMRYELPPPQEKADPTEIRKEEFFALAEKAKDMPADKWILASFCGVSPASAREIAYRAAGATDAPVSDVAAFFAAFSGVFSDLKHGKTKPSLVKSEAGALVEYGFLPLTQYGKTQSFDSPSELLDVWFSERDRAARVKQRAADLLHLVGSSRNRILRKLELQRGELALCREKDAYRRAGDLIIANCHAIARGDCRAELIDYTDLLPDGGFGKVTVELDARLSPAANAQRYYKKYNKCKTAETELTRQIEIGESELSYLDSVAAALAGAEGAEDLAEIREELAAAGYGVRGGSAKGRAKKAVPAFAEYRTSGGYRVLCGKNNLQNEYITHKVAEKDDFWFHAKNKAGSHVVLLLEGKGEPPATDFTEAAEIAALFSAASGAPMTEVDYTTVRQLKKVPGARPGFVVYHTNYSATVSPNREKIAAMRIK